MRLRQYGRGALLAAAAIGGFCLPNIGCAQEPRQEFNVASTNLSDALLSIGRQANVEVLFSSDQVAGRQVAPLHGTYSVREAISRLLVGTDLIADYQDGGFVIRGRSSESHAAELSSPAREEAGIVVTGTRIRSGENASPNFSSSREEILDTGKTDLGQFIRSMPQNFTGGQNPTVFASVGDSENVTNSSTLNLRGLGQDATLTLINGHRVAYEGVSQGVDISSIPLIAIERVDVVTDGSSAIYGSDAVGGVANVILRRDYVGGSVSARYGFTTGGGFEQQQYSAITGTRWDSGGFLIAGDLLRWTPIKARQRPFAASFSPNDPILPAQKQVSAIASGHQNLSDRVEFSIDAQYNHRQSPNGYSNSPPNDYYFDGQAIDRTVKSFSVAPSVKIILTSDWTATISAMYSESNTHIINRAFFDSSEYQRTNLTYDNSASSAELGVEGGLLQLPGGTARLATGLGYRSNGLRLNSEIYASGLSQVSDRFDASRDVAFAYGELYVPLIGPDNARGGLRALSANAAIRYERYEGGQSVATPKMGFVYSPVAGITFKGSWGKSFKAQTINQEFQQKNVALLNGAIIQGYSADRNFLYLYGGGTNLKPERATTWSGTLSLEPVFANGLRIEASYFNVHFRDRVTTPLTSVYAALSDPINAELIAFDPSAAQQASLIDASAFGLRNFTGAPYDPALVGLVVDNRFRNAASQVVEGIDLALDYSIVRSGGSTITLRGGGSYLESKRQGQPGQRYVALAGTLYNPPHWRGQASIDFASQLANINFTLNYIGGVTDNRADTSYDVPSFISLDWTLRLHSPAKSGPLAGMECIFSVQNILNERPGTVRPLSPFDPSWDSANYPSIGRAINLTVTKQF